MRALLSGILVALLLAGCADAPPAREDAYTVQEHDTLYSIAWRHGLDYRDLARWNGLGTDYRIVIGQRLKLHPQAGLAGQVTPSVPPSPPAAPLPPLALRPGERVAWIWPTARSGKPQPARSGGLLFPGHPGQAVLAAARGRVVYTGSGIRGYGQLVILKHSATLLSAYAYNDQVTVREGEEVAAGQAIATMGRGPHQRPALYFEIRIDGRPTNPVPYLQGLK
jgi:lipoprotein NlpD